MKAKNNMKACCCHLQFFLRCKESIETSNKSVESNYLFLFPRTCCQQKHVLLSDCNTIFVVEKNCLSVSIETIFSKKYYILRYQWTFSYKTTELCWVELLVIMILNFNHQLIKARQKISSLLQTVKCTWKTTLVRARE